MINDFGSALAVLCIMERAKAVKDNNLKTE